MDEMKKYVNRTGKEVAFVPFEQYSWFPFYDSMNKQQKAWYFYWRTEARKQHYLTTDLSYVFVHLYEILNGFGWENASDGYAQMLRIWLAYRECFPKLDNYLQEWMFDFAKFHHLDHNVPEEVAKLIPVQATLRDMWLDKHCKDKPLKLPLEMIGALCDYSIYGSKFYKSGNQLLVAEAISRVIALIDASLWAKKGKGILLSYGPEKKMRQRYYAFRGALYYGDKDVKISVKPYTSHPQLREYVNEIVRYAENVLREIFDFSGRLRDIKLDKDTTALISHFLRKEYSPKNVEREVVLDPEKIDALRIESNAVRDALNVGESNVVNNSDVVNSGSDILGREIQASGATADTYFSVELLSDEFKDAILAMPCILQKALYVIVKSESVSERLQTLADAEMTMPDILIDEINEVTSQYIDDILIDTFGDVPSVLEQYEQELQMALIE